MKSHQRIPALVAACLTLAACCLSAHAAGQPNIVFIFMDDMGYGDVGVLNPERGKIATPHMDRVAEQGMIFTDAHTSSAVCTPSRYGLMTGRYNWRTRLQRHVLDGFGKALIPESRMTVASLLKAQGYATGMIGKWHIGMNFPKGTGKQRVDWKGRITVGPHDVGFDYFFGISGSLDMPPYIFIENDRFVGEATVMKEPHPNRKGPAEPDFEVIEVLDQLAEKSVEFIGKQSGEKPFFAYLALPSPHSPVVPSPEWQGRSGLGKYGDFMMQTDAFVGTIVKALDDAGFTDNTLLIVSSDNGFSEKQGGAAELEAQGHFPSAGYRGYKADIWEGGHRVPFLVKWPGHVKAGTTSDATICLTDFMATCADLTGAELPADAGEDSVSFLPALAGEKIETSRKGIIHHSIKGSFAYREGKWKLVLSKTSGGFRPGKAPKNAPKGQLYDMEADPGETRNLFATHPEVVERLLAQLETYVKRGRSTDGPDVPNDVKNINIWK
ncbi:MAG: sulfatase family protein [Verrucomicrobiota bacterium JB025]|nr:arylsulfatase [Verrucomicrobiota bacterium JB025]